MTWKFNPKLWEKEELKTDFSYIGIFGAIIGSLIAFLKFRQLRIQKNRQLESKERLDMQKDWKKIWIVIFCVASLVACLFYVPNLKIDYKGEVTGETFYSTAFEEKQGYLFKNSQVDYQAMLFRELVILIACLGGYTVSTMLKK